MTELWMECAILFLLPSPEGTHFPSRMHGIGGCVGRCAYLRLVNILTGLLKT